MYFSLRNDFVTYSMFKISMSQKIGTILKPLRNCKVRTSGWKVSCPDDFVFFMFFFFFFLEGTLLLWLNGMANVGLYDSLTRS